MTWYELSKENVLKELDTRMDGLTYEEASDRLKHYGENQLTEGKRPGALKVFLSQFADLMVIILMVAAVISMFTKDLESTLVIIAVLILNAVLGTVQHMKAEKSLDSLKSLSSPVAKVIRQHVDIEIIHKIENEVTPEDVVNMQYTSGTTGFPKGVMLTSRNIINDGFIIGERMRYTENDKLCLLVPLFHCFGIVLGVMAVLTHGGTHVLLESFDPLVALASIQKEKCTSLYGVPTMFIAELNHPMFSMFDLSSLRTGIMAGSGVPVELMKRVNDEMHMPEITSVYGLTETSPGMTQSHWNDSLEVRATTVGDAFEGIDVKVLDPETGKECPVGVQGEMCCKGWNVMKGYYKMPEATAETIDKNGYLHSGDLGIKDENGNYHITGRIKDMIIRGGENIYPREIEEFLIQMPEIKDIQVAAVKSERYGEITGAFIILHEGKTLTEQDVIEFCRDKLSKFKWPQLVMFLDEFPMTGSGKIQKFKLTEIGTKYRREVLKVED